MVTFNILRLKQTEMQLRHIAKRAEYKVTIQLLYLNVHCSLIDHFPTKQYFQSKLRSRFGFDDTRESIEDNGNSITRYHIQIPKKAQKTVHIAFSTLFWVLYRIQIPLTHKPKITFKFDVGNIPLPQLFFDKMRVGHGNFLIPNMSARCPEIKLMPDYAEIGVPAHCGFQKQGWLPIYGENKRKLMLMLLACVIYALQSISIY